MRAPTRKPQSAVWPRRAPGLFLDRLRPIHHYRERLRLVVYALQKEESPAVIRRGELIQPRRDGNSGVEQTLRNARFRRGAAPDRHGHQVAFKREVEQFLSVFPPVCLDAAAL